jgi:putative endopeptidase
MRKYLFITTAAFAILIVASTSCKHATESGSFHNYIDSANMDLSVAPGDDFFSYANGTWIKNTPIPASEVWWGTAKISENDNFKKIKTLLEEAASSSPSDKNEKMVGDMYTSGMDTVGIDKLGISPIKADLDRIATIKNTDDLLAEITLDYTMGVPNTFGFGAGSDLKNSSEVVAYFGQGGLGLPEKGYYFNTDADTKKIRAAYLQYITNMLVFTGASKNDAAKSAQNIFDLETALAKASKSPVELRDIDANYHKYSLKDLVAAVPGIKWRSLMAQLKIKEDSLVVAQPEFFKELSVQLSKASLDTWKDYLKFHFIDNVAIFLDKDINHEHYNFDDKTLNGQKVPLERWDQVSRVIDNLMADPLGHTYVNKYFPPEAKARMDTLVTNVEAAFEERIKKLDWMSDTTKQKAITKLHAIVRKIAYPDKWRDYGTVKIDPATYCENALACKSYLYQDMLNYLKGKKSDRSRWGMTPPTVNAEYDPSLNTIEFPAGILQYPFFAIDADDAINYGGIGLVIGHELTHGFDDQGRQFDEHGNRKNWWTAADEKRFKQKADQIVKLYDGYKILDSLHVNGSLTEGENIADFGGLAISFDAFKKTAQYKAGKKIGGFTPAERYFLSFAQCRRRKMTDDFLKAFIKTDPHAPSWYRIIGPYSNFDEFYKTYNLKPGQKMYRAEADRISIW